MTAIRLATRADAILLPDIEQSAGERFREAPGLEWVADDDNTPAEAYPPLIASGTVWGAERDGRLIGFLAAAVESEALHVLELAVVRESQGQGAGRALMAAATEKARALGLRALTLTTFRDLAWNEGFYMRLGFRTLQAHDLGERLSGCLAKEVARGLPAERRCAMRLAL